MNLSKEKKLMSSFLNLQFNYCLFIWMLENRVINNTINCLHERYFRLLYGDKSSSFEKLLGQGKSVTIHTRNLQILATEKFKIYRNISPPIFSEIFHQLGNNYNIRINSDFAMPNVRFVFHGSESISYLGPKIWNIVPLELKESTIVAAALKKVLKSGSQKTVHVGYVRNTYPI